MDILQYAGTVLGQIAIMALLMTTGYLLTKFHMLTKNTVEELTFIVFKIITPCVIVNSFLNVKFTPEYIKCMIFAALLAVFSHLLGIVAGLIFMRIKDHSKRSVYRFGCLISNAGFIALPLAQAALNADGVLLVSIYIIVLNVFLWTAGKAMFPQDEKISVMKVLSNPGVIGILGGILVLLLKQVYLPQPVSGTISMISQMNAPVAMIITGYYLVGTNVKKALCDGFSWLVIFIRHILLPIAALLIFRYIFNITDVLLTSSILPICAPCGVIVIMFAASFGGNEKTASQMASLSTVLSVITMPLILILCQII